MCFSISKALQGTWLLSLCRREWNVLMARAIGDRRERVIKDLLARNAQRLDDWMTRGLVGSLKIPMTWVNSAKVCSVLRHEHSGTLMLLPGNLRAR